MKATISNNKKSIHHVSGVLLLAAVCIVLAAVPGCSTSEEVTEPTDPKLTVTVGDGVQGTPATGDYYYPEGTVVEYQYSLEEYYSDLEVTIEGEPAPASGTITMDASYALRATAQPRYEIVGTWDLTEEYDDGSAFQVTLIFTGTNEEGTVTDSQGGSGTYTVNEYHFVEFTLVFPEVSYDYGGYFDGSHTISGTCERTTPANIFTGTFSATRITPTPTLLPKLSAADQPPSQSKTN
jgi:hypothetical protein